MFLCSYHLFVVRMLVAFLPLHTVFFSRLCADEDDVMPHFKLFLQQKTYSGANSDLSSLRKIFYMIKNIPGIYIRITRINFYFQYP
jgi:hypothetical protein